MIPEPPGNQHDPITEPHERLQQELGMKFFSVLLHRVSN
jgi:hypothetical protein